MTLTYAELFAGAGGLSRGLEAAGFHCVAHAEIEPHARAVLRYRWPDTRLDGDVTQINGADYAGITLMSGGSPCQDLSVAGKRAGLAGGRSGLFHEQCRIWQESGAPYLLWENVAGAFSSNRGKDFATVLSSLVGATIPVPADGWATGGVAAGRDAVAAWRVLDLQHFGPPQRRVRVFVLAARAGGVDPAEVLALAEGVCGHPSPRQQAREGTTAGLVGRFEGGCVGTLETRPQRAGAHEAAQGHVLAIGLDGEKNADIELIGCLNTGSKSGSGQQPAVLAFHHTQTPISGDVLAFDNRPQVMEDGTTNTLTTEGMRNPMSVVCTTGDITHALTHEGADASEDGTGRGTPIVVGRDVMPTLPASLGKGPGHNKDDLTVVGTLDAHDATKWGSHQWEQQGKCMVSAGRPRRLTPKECERLMSWPDDWTRYGRKEDGSVYELSDTARYRLCGNGVGSVCVEWIAQRLADAIAQHNGLPMQEAA